jgi:monovalent cation:H+ antiporter-2, CPA2 family
VAVPALLLGGAALGPHGVGLLTSGVALEAATEVGLVLLLFYTALFTHRHALRRGGRIALPLAAYHLLLNFAAAYWIGALFGWGLDGTLLLAGVLTSSSTGAVLKFLSDEGRLRRREGNVVVALLWLEDLAFIAFFLFVASRHSYASRFGLDEILGLALYAAFLLAVRFLRDAVWRTPRELLVLVVTALGLVGASLGAWGGLPPGGAAFATGLLLAGRRGAPFVQREAPYVRDASAAVFFFAFGALIDPVVARHVLPVAAASLLALGATTFLILPRLARLLGLARPEALVVGTSLLARGGKSASFAKLGAATPHGAAVLGVTGLLTLVLTPLAPLILRLVLRLRPGRVVARADVVSHSSRRALAPGDYAQRHLTPAWDRLALVGWLLLPLLLGLLASLLPTATRWAPAAIGLALIPWTYTGVRDYFRRSPSSASNVYRHHRSPLPRLEAYLPQILMGPCVLALLLPLAAPWALLTFPALIALAFTYLLLLPHLVRAPLAVTRGRVLVRRPRERWTAGTTR